MRLPFSEDGVGDSFPDVRQRWLEKLVEGLGREEMPDGDVGDHGIPSG
jgi:hypothetical protein